VTDDISVGKFTDLKLTQLYNVYDMSVLPTVAVLKSAGKVNDSNELHPSRRLYKFRLDTDIDVGKTTSDKLAQ
jgi:hypothetical protein